MLNINESVKKNLQKAINELISIKCEYANFVLRQKQVLKELATIESDLVSKIEELNKKFTEQVSSVKTFIVPDGENLEDYHLDIQNWVFLKKEKQNE